MVWIGIGAFALVGIVFTLILMKVFSVGQKNLTDPKRITTPDNVMAPHIAELIDADK